MQRLLLTLYLLLYPLIVLAWDESPSDQTWDLKAICSMDSADYWTGPWPASDIKASSDCVEGQGSIEIHLNIQPNHHVRIEKNFVCDCHDGFQNMMAFGMVDQDFSPYRTITFQYKTDINRLEDILFRVYDREGGWLQWQIPSSSQNNQWQKITLSIPPYAYPKFNFHRVGGMIWEINTGEQEINGTMWLDDLQLLTDTQNGIAGTAHRPEKVNHQIGLNPPPINDAYPTKDIHLIMNMTGEIGISIYECNTTEAIKRFSEAVAVFDDVSGLEFFWGAEAFQIRRDSPNREAWFAKSRITQIAIASWCEENNVPFYLGIAHGGDGSLVTPLETVIAVVKAAPQTCRGALMGEFSIETNNGIDETEAILKFLKPRGLKLLYFQQSSYWYGILMPHGDEFRRRILSPKFKDVFVPMWENLLPAAQGLCMSSVMGLWRSGLTNDWGVSAQSWGYANMNWGGTSDQPGNIWLRMFLSVAAFGGRYIEIEPKWAFDGENVPGQIAHFKQWAHNLRWVGRRRAQIDIDLDPSGPMRALRLMNNLIQSETVVPPTSPDKLLALSSAAFQVEHTENWRKWGLFHRGTDSDFYDGCCSNYTEMSVQTPHEDAFSYLYGSNHLYDQTFPVNANGLVTIMPKAEKEPSDYHPIKTDGINVLIDGEWVQAGQAREPVKEIFDAYKSEMLFSAENCTWSAIQLSERDFLIVLIDPEERFPIGVTTTLKCNLPGQLKYADGITSAELRSNEKGLTIEIEPASFRLIRVQQQ